jgi:hypothetical protein
MDTPEPLLKCLPTALWWLTAVAGPCLLALIPTGSAQKGGRP